MSAFVLVHGSWHGAWCWYKVVPRLRALGHHVDAVELPGHGRDRTPSAQVTLDGYAERIRAAIDAAPEPPVVVAHSRGGIAASQAAEGRADGIRALVYLAAYLLRDGETVVDMARHDHESLVMPNLDVDPDGHWDMLRADAFEPALYADCGADDIALAHHLLTPEPLAPSLTPLRLSESGFGRIRRVYVELLADRAVTPTLQQRMYTRVPCAEVRSIAAGHSAYFSAPDELTAHLDGVAASAA